MTPYTSALSDSVLGERRTVLRKENAGEFWKPCPGTGSGYCCCGYQILSPAIGCGMYCTYCVLQSYFGDCSQTVYTNLDALSREVADKMARRHGVVRFGTGEFADSLYLEDRFGLSQQVAVILEPYPNVLVEFKSKSTNIAGLRNIHTPGKVVVGFSLNTSHVISEFEAGTASLEERLAAAGECERMGFWVAFHFDPMIWYPTWEADYRELVDLTFAALRSPERIAWWSLGGFRAMPRLKKLLKEQKRHLPLFAGEMALAHDRKLRYFRSMRAEFYHAVQEQVEKYSPDTTLYLCMESNEVWRESGMNKRTPHGLVVYLDQRAEQMLGLSTGEELE